MPLPSPKTGMTLVEILVALIVVAVIAVIAIPQVINAGSADDVTHQRQVIKQVATQLEAAYTQYRLNTQTVPTTFKLLNLTPYLNYVSYDSTSQVDGTPCFSGTPIDCSSSYFCYHMNNGSMLVLNNSTFNNNSNTNAVHFWVDPDAKVTGATGDIGKALNVYLYYNGRMKNRGAIDPFTYDSAGWTSPMTSCDPNWWSWN